MKRRLAIVSTALILSALLGNSTLAEAAPHMTRPSITASPSSGKPGTMVTFKVYGVIDNSPQAVVYWCTTGEACSPGGAETKICTGSGKVTNNETVCVGRIPKTANPLGRHGLLGYQEKDDIQAHGAFTLT
jgi:hypothetical protein